MRCNLSKTIYAALFALLIGAFSPGTASACTVTPASDNSTSVRLVTPDDLQRSLQVFPVSEHFWRWDKDAPERHHLFWSGDGAWAPVVFSSSHRLFLFAVTPTDPTPKIPEPSTLALLSLGTLVLGAGLASRRFKPAIGPV